MKQATIKGRKYDLIPTDVLLITLQANFTQKDLDEYLTISTGFLRITNPKQKELFSEFYEIGKVIVYFYCDQSVCEYVQGGLLARGVHFEEPVLC